MRTVLDAVVRILHQMAYRDDRKLSAIEPIVFLSSSVIPLADFFNRSSISSTAVNHFWDLVSAEWPLELDFIENDLPRPVLHALTWSVINTGRLVSLWAIGSPDRPEHWQVFNLNDLAYMAYPRRFEPGSYGPGGLFAHLSLADPFCRKLAEDFKEPIEKGKADNGFAATVEHAASPQAL